MPPTLIVSLGDNDVAVGDVTADDEGTVAVNTLSIIGSSKEPIFSLRRR